MAMMECSGGGTGTECNGWGEEVDTSECAEVQVVDDTEGREEARPVTAELVRTAGSHARRAGETERQVSFKGGLREDSVRGGLALVTEQDVTKSGPRGGRTAGAERDGVLVGAGKRVDRERHKVELERAEEQNASQTEQAFQPEGKSQPVRSSQPE